MLKARHIVIPTSLKQQVLGQLHTNHMGIEKTKLLAHKSVYWYNRNVDIKEYIKTVPHVLNFSKHSQKTIHHDIPLRPWEVLGADIFLLNKKNYLCIVDYHSKFPIVKRLEGLSAESLITKIKVIFSEYGIPQKLMSDAGTNLISDKFWQLCKTINVVV